MTEWKEYKLGEIASFKTGKLNSNAAVENGIYPFFTCSPITYAINEYAYNQKAILLAGNNAEGNFSVKYYEGKFNAYQRTYIIESNNGICDLKFLYYSLKLCLQEFKHISQGTSTKFLTSVILNNFSISLPPLPEQHRIAAILSSLDDKIDLLHRENATLEQMAETLFKQWFVVEAKEEWEEGKLGDYVELVNGVSYKGDELQPSNVAMVTLKSFDRNGGFRMDGYKEFTGKFKKEQVLYDGDLVVAHTDITQEADVIGNPVIVIGKNQYETITFSMDVVKVVSKSEFFSNSFLYYLMKTQAFKEHCLGYANGSTVLHLSKKAIPEFEFHIPPKIIAQSFQKQVESINKKILNNNNEIQTLIQQRDSLLPKLMSGEVKI